MGYTHYWTLARPITADEVGALAEDVRKIIAASGVPGRLCYYCEKSRSLDQRRENR